MHNKKTFNEALQMVYFGHLNFDLILHIKQITSLESIYFAFI